MRFSSDSRRDSRREMYASRCEMYASGEGNCVLVGVSVGIFGCV